MWADSDSGGATRTPGQRAAVISLRHVAEFWECTPLSPRSWFSLGAANRLASCHLHHEWSERIRSRHSIVEVGGRLLHGSKGSEAALQSRLRSLPPNKRGVARALYNLGMSLDSVDECRRDILRCVRGAWLHSPRVREFPGALFLAAVAAGRIDVTKLILSCAAERSRGAETSLTEEDLAESLHVASKAGHPKLARLLLSSGANPDNCRNLESWRCEGITPLMRAARLGQLDMVEMLLDAQATVDLQTEDSNRTALHCACERAQAAVVRLLLDRGANPHRSARVENGGVADAFEAAAATQAVVPRWGLQQADANAVAQELRDWLVRARRRVDEAEQDP